MTRPASGGGACTQIAAAGCSAAARRIAHPLELTHAAPRRTRARAAALAARHADSGPLAFHQGNPRGNGGLVGKLQACFASFSADVVQRRRGIDQEVIDRRALQQRECRRIRPTGRPAHGGPLHVHKSVNPIMSFGSRGCKPGTTLPASYTVKIPCESAFVSL